MIVFCALLLALALSFALSGLESAVLTVSRVRMRHAASAGDRRAARLLPLVEDRDALLGAITVSNHVSNLAAFLLVVWHLPPQAGPWGVFLAFILALPLFLVGLEVLPKKLFRRYPFRSLRALAPLVHCAGLFRPVFRALAVSALPPQDVPAQSSGRDDLGHHAEQLSRQGLLSPGAARLIRRILDYRPCRAGELMRPLARAVALPSEQPLESALIIARQHDLATLPVIGDDGRFIGVLDLTRLPACLPPGRRVRHHMRTLETVHAGDPALATLQLLRRRGQTLALVRDESGDAIGLLREEDLLARLLGTGV